MTQRLEIEGQIARLVETAVISEVPLSEMMPFLTFQQPTFLPVLPDHSKVVAFNPETKRGAILIELPPAKKYLRIHNDRYNTTGQDAERQNKEQDQVGVFGLQMPWQYFMWAFRIGGDQAIVGGQLQDFTIDQGLYFWRKEKISKLEDGLWPGAIPNVDNSGWICWGNSRHDTTSLADRINDMVRNFTNTKFNYHLGARMPAEYRQYTSWEKASDNPLVYQTWNMWNTPHSYTVHSLFQDILMENLAQPSDLSHSEYAIPEPPPQFTVAKASEWMDSLPEQSRNRFLHALRRWTDEHPHQTEDTNGPEEDATPDTTPEAAPDRRRAEG